MMVRSRSTLYLSRSGYYPITAFENIEGLGSIDATVGFGLSFMEREKFFYESIVGSRDFWREEACGLFRSLLLP